MMEIGAFLAQLHERADQAAAGNPAQVHVPAAIGAGLRRDRAVQRAAQEIPGLWLQGGDAQPHQSARPRGRMGSRRSSTSFRNDAAKVELVGERDTPTGRVLLSRATDRRSRTARASMCHSTVAAAPKTMVELYGQANGFGWKLNEIVGAQIASVPSALPVQRANRTLPAGSWCCYTVVFIADHRAAQRDAAHDGDPARETPLASSPTR